MNIPIDTLQPETLINIVESFVLREGTDYGESNFTLKEKVESVLAQLRAGEAVLVYSEEYDSIDIKLAKNIS